MLVVFHLHLPNHQSPSQVPRLLLSLRPLARRASGEPPIKGGNSGIYHLPGGAFYERTTNPVTCFATPEDAIEAGFRQSQS
jgi:hypothetical protein